MLKVMSRTTKLFEGKGTHPAIDPSADATTYFLQPGAFSFVNIAPLPGRQKKHCPRTVLDPLSSHYK
jgi:hypothetical protein